MTCFFFLGLFSWVEYNFKYLKSNHQQYKVYTYTDKFHCFTFYCHKLHRLFEGTCSDTIFWVIFLSEIHCVFFLDLPQDDEPIRGGADGRGNSHLRKFLSQRHKKLPWKPEVNFDLYTLFIIPSPLPCFLCSFEPLPFIPQTDNNNYFKVFLCFQAAHHLKLAGPLRRLPVH